MRNFFQRLHRLTKIVALNRAEANETYFESPAALSFVIAPLLCTVKRITEVTYSKDVIIDIVIVNVIAIAIVIVIASDIVIHTAHFGNFLQR